MLTRLTDAAMTERQVFSSSQDLAKLRVRGGVLQATFWSPSPLISCLLQQQISLSETHRRTRRVKMG